MVSASGPNLQPALPDPVKKEGAAAPQDPAKNTTQTEKGLFHRKGTKERTSKVVEKVIVSFLSGEDSAKAAGTNLAFSNSNRAAIVKARIRNQAVKHLASIIPEEFSKGLSEIKDTVALEKRICEILKDDLKYIQFFKSERKFAILQGKLSFQEQSELIKVIFQNISRCDYITLPTEQGMTNQWPMSISGMWAVRAMTLSEMLDSTFEKNEFVNFIDMFFKRLGGQKYSKDEKDLILNRINRYFLLKTEGGFNKPFDFKHIDVYVEVLQKLVKAELPILDQIKSALICPLAYWGQELNSAEPKMGSPFAVILNNASLQDKEQMLKILSGYEQKDPSNSDFVGLFLGGNIGKWYKIQTEELPSESEVNRIVEVLCKYVRFPEIVSLIKGEKHVVNVAETEQRIKNIEAFLSRFGNQKNAETIMKLFREKLNLNSAPP